MKEIKPDRYVSLQDFKQPQLLVGACSDLSRNPSLFYEIARTQGQPAELRLLAAEAYEALVSGLDSGVSKPILINEITLPVQTAAVRFEEVFRVCNGDTGIVVDNPNVEYTESINYSGFQRKITDIGTRLLTITETVESQGGKVSVQYPISSTDSISAAYSGGSLQVAGAGGTTAKLTIQDLTYESVVAAAAANNVTVQYLDATAAKFAELTVAGVKLVAGEAGEAGNEITITMNDGAPNLGAETMEVNGNAVTFTIVAGQSTAALIANLVNTYEWGEDPALITAEVLSAAAFQDVLEETPLAGGADKIGAAGAEVVTVSGMDISVQLESGVSTAEQVKAALDGSPDAMQLVSVDISGEATNPQMAPIETTHLSGGQDVEANLKLGEVELAENGGSISDGTPVEISYQTQSYTVYRLQMGAGKIYYIAKVSLLDYLSDNAAS